MTYIKSEDVLKALNVFSDYENGNEDFLDGIETAKEIVENISGESTHAEKFVKFMEEHTKMNEENGGKTVAVAKEYKPLYIHVIACELSIMNDYLSRIAEALEGHANEG